MDRFDRLAMTLAGYVAAVTSIHAEHAKMRAASIALQCTRMVGKSYSLPLTKETRPELFAPLEETGEAVFGVLLGDFVTDAVRRPDPKTSFLWDDSSFVYGMIVAPTAYDLRQKVYPENESVVAIAVVQAMVRASRGIGWIFDGPNFDRLSKMMTKGLAEA